VAVRESLSAFRRKRQPEQRIPFPSKKRLLGNSQWSQSPLTWDHDTVFRTRISRMLINSVGIIHLRQDSHPKGEDTGSSAPTALSCGSFQQRGWSSSRIESHPLRSSGGVLAKLLTICQNCESTSPQPFGTNLRSHQFLVMVSMRGQRTAGRNELSRHCAKVQMPLKLAGVLLVAALRTVVQQYPARPVGRARRSIESYVEKDH
jgi:hypothetical protein